jgi:hypothetical protein
MQCLRPKVTPSLVIALLALFIAAGGGNAVAEIVISDNSQVAKGTISGHNAPAGTRSNIIRGSVSGKDLSPGLRTGLLSLVLSCPDGMRRAADVCYEPELRANATLETALATCAGAGLRLPRPSELALAFEHEGAPQEFQWVDAWSRSLEAKLTVGNILRNGEDRSLELGWNALSDVRIRYRCVTSPTN